MAATHLRPGIGSGDYRMNHQCWLAEELSRQCRIHPQHDLVHHVIYECHVILPNVGMAWTYPRYY